MKYVDRCLKKAVILFNEIRYEVSEEHVHKVISILWAIIELFLRAIVYRYKHTTYDKPGKLISVFDKSILPIIGVSEDIVSKLNSLYNLRRRTVHRPDIMGFKELRKGLTLFCQITDILSNELKRLNPSIEKALRSLRELCISITI